ncbi:MAG: HEAT repeat domain-containing protein [Phycisphaerales bacterium]
MHIELAPERRSELIIELLSDSREGHQLLGFELADRDLSASVDLSDAVGIAVRGLIESEAAQIRAQSARLITRLGQPDAMLVLTDALQTEDSPIAAEPMLLGIARWPNGDALNSVRRWIDREDAPLFACFSAAWSIEREGLWAPGQNHAHMISRLRRSGPREMREDGMKLLAKLGTAEDLRRLIGFMLSEDPNVVRWAASALVETPRAVEELLLAASKNEVLYQAAAESLIQHRATPEGMRRLSELPQADSQVRRDMLLRMGRVIDREQLGEAVRLARLDEETAISVLSRLVGNEEPITARSAKGVLQLAELQLRAGRPNRVIEAILSLENATIEPEDQARLIAYRTKAMLLLGRFQEAADDSIVASTWIEAIGLASDPQLKRRIATELTSRAGESLDEAQLELLIPFTRPVETPEKDKTQSQTED